MKLSREEKPTGNNKLVTIFINMYMKNTYYKGGNSNYPRRYRISDRDMTRIGKINTVDISSALQTTELVNN